MEVLVMLAITALLSVVVLETIRASASNGIRIENAARVSAQGYLTRASLRNAIQGTRPQYADKAATFRGSEMEFSALTTRPLVSQTPAPTAYTVRLIQNTDSLTLVYEDHAGQFMLENWPGATGVFGYYGEQQNSQAARPLIALNENRRIWSQIWPIEILGAADSGTYFIATPEAISLNIQHSDGQTETLIFHIVTNAPPPMRIQDLFGAGAR